MTDTDYVDPDAVRVKPELSLVATAKRYAAHGHHIFPLHSPVFTPGKAARCSCGNPNCNKIGKHPRTWHGHLDARPDASPWQRYPGSNIGLATGAINGVTVLDVDPRHDGDKSLAELERQHGPLPSTPRHRTGSGGDHFFFQYVPGSGGSASELGPGLDIKSGGGYVVLPPSMHQSGQRYEKLTAGELAPAPDWLVTWLGAAKRTSRRG